MPNEPYISNMAYIPLSYVDNLGKLKQELTVIPTEFDKKKIPKPICLYNLAVKDYIGVPIDWGITKFSHLKFQDRTSRGNGLLLNATKAVNPDHPKAPKGQRKFIEDIISACGSYYTCFAIADTGCHAKGTKVMMANGTFKKVEDVTTEDYLMGQDSSPKKVNKLFRGHGKMYKVVPVKGDSFICNEDHVLRLKSTPARKGQEKQFVDIKIKDYVTKSDRFKHLHKLYRVPIDFDNAEVDVPAYILGLLIGDGSLHRQVAFTNSKPELYGAVNNYAKSLGDKVRVQESDKSISYYYAGCNLRNKLETLSLYNVWSADKFIPDNYKYNSKEVRLNILAGLLDTDGYTDGKSFEYCTKSMRLSEDVKYVCRSLGLSAYSSVKVVKGTEYYRVSISGDCSIIPTLCKTASPRSQIKDNLVTGFTLVPIEDDNYYGFNVEDNLYLLEDFIVTHNSGKTVSALAVASHFNMRTLVVVNKRSLATQWINEIQEKLGIDKSRVALISGKASKDIKEMKASICVAVVKTLVDNEFSEEFRSSFGTVILDEVHSYGSDKFSKVVNLFNSTITLGLTATDERGDGAESCYRFTLGPHRAVSRAESLPLTVYTLDIQGKPLYGDNIQLQKNQIIKNVDRNRLIAEIAADAYKQGRHILVLSDRIEHLEELMQRTINLGVPDKDCGLLTAQKTVNGKRVQVKSEEFEHNKHNVVIRFGTFGCCRQGLDIPILSVLIYATPVSKCTQPDGRIRRLYADKPNPIAVDLVDQNSHLMVGMYGKRLKQREDINATTIKGMPVW